MRWCGLLVLAGCGAEPPPDLPMDIVVGPGGAALYLRGADLAPCRCEVPLFPAIAECVHASDGHVCVVEPGASCQSCLTKRVVEGNELVLAGCGREETRIPIGEAPFITPVISATIDGDIPIVSWTADAPAASAMVSILGELESTSCHVAGTSQHRFEQPLARPRYASVTTFAPPIELDTAFGHATIWRGSSASTMVPAP